MSTTTNSPTWALRLHAAFDWVLWILTVNALWYAFTLLGGVILGVAPASAAAGELTRRRLRGEVFPALRSFWSAWRRGFWASNAALGPGFAAVVLLAAAVLGMSMADTLGSPFGVASLGSLVVAAAVMTVAVPMHAHYELTTSAYLVTASKWMLRNIPHVLILGIVAVAVIGAGFIVPGIIPFLSVGGWITASTAMCLGFFAANDRRLADQR